MFEILLNKSVRIESKRLFLRPFQASDAEWYYAMSLKNKEHLRRYEFGNPVMTIESVEDARKVLVGMSLDWGKNFFLGAFNRQNGEFIAQIYIGVVNWGLPEYRVGYFVEQGHEGQGYVTEAVLAALDFIFETLGAQRASLECSDTNSRSYHVAERCGMLREAHFRQNKHTPDGAVEGTLFFGMLRSEWEARRAYEPAAITLSPAISGPGE